MAEKVKQVVDFNKLRKRRQRFTTVKRLLILAGVLLLLFGAVSLNSLLVEESFTTKVSDLFSGFGGSGYPVTVPGGIIRSVQAVGNHLAVLNDTNLYLYNAKGKQVGNFQKMGDYTVLLTGESRMLTYDRNAKRYAIHSRSKTLLEQETEYSLIAAGMNSRGDYAIVSDSKQAICEINVYNKRFEHVFVCTFAENIVYSVDISPKGNMMAAGWVNTRDGMLYSGVNLYLFSSDQVYASLEIADEWVLGVWFQEEDRIAVLTDRGYRILSSDGKVRDTYSFDNRQLTEIRQEGRQTLLLLEDKEARIRDVVLLDSSLDEQAVHTTTDRVMDIALTSRRIYLLGEDSIDSYNLKFELDDSEPVQHGSRICQAGSKLYYLDREYISQLGQAERLSEDDPAEDGMLREEDNFEEWRPAGESAAGDDGEEDSLSGEADSESPEETAESSGEGDLAEEPISEEPATQDRQEDS